MAANPDLVQEAPNPDIEQEAPNQVYSAFMNVLAQSPPLLELHPDCAHASKETRKPLYFDTHLDDELILHRIKRHKTFCTEFTEFAEKWIRNRCLDPVPLDVIRWIDELSTAASHEQETQESVLYKDEAEVVDYFVTNVALTVRDIAAFLMFGENADSLTEWKNQLEVSKTPDERSEAVADAFLSLEGKGREGFGVNNTLLVWEYKTPDAGSPEVRAALNQLVEEEEFRWFRCLGASETTCRDSRGHVILGNYVFTQEPRSPDSTALTIMHYNDYNLIPSCVPPKPQYRRIEHIKAEERGNGIVTREHAQYMIQQVRLS